MSTALRGDPAGGTGAATEVPAVARRVRTAKADTVRMVSVGCRLGVGRSRDRAK